MENNIAQGFFDGKYEGKSKTATDGAAGTRRCVLMTILILLNVATSGWLILCIMTLLSANPCSMTDFFTCMGVSLLVACVTCLFSCSDCSRPYDSK